MRTRETKLIKMISGAAIAWLKLLPCFALQAGNDNLCLTVDQPGGSWWLGRYQSRRDLSYVLMSLVQITSGKGG